MSKSVKGNIKGISQVDIKKIEKLYNEKISPESIIQADFAKVIYRLSEKIGRIIGVIISREGGVEEVFVGDKNILYIPNLGRYRMFKGRLRRIRLIATILKDNFELNSDYYTDLQKLRLDMIVGIKEINGNIQAKYAYLVPYANDINSFSQTEVINNLDKTKFNFLDFISNLENELTSNSLSKSFEESDNDIVLIGVYEKDFKRDNESIAELKELAISADYNVLEVIVQKREIDPKTILGKGKLEEIMLKCLSLGANTIVFDRELKPSELRNITNITKLRVLDRSMLILDIFAKRATSSEGRLQVELAKLKYELPRILEKHAGLSRLTGGIGSRGPGETKLELGKRRMNDRINALEKKLVEISKRRELRQKKRRLSEIPLVSILGYTNAGKSTLFNALTSSQVETQNKLFATLDTTRGKLCIVGHKNNEKFKYCNLVLSDTVGFIRDLPSELKTAFKATLDELYDASLLLHVVDASNPDALHQYRAVVEILREMDLGDIPRIVIFNKCDIIDEEFDLETLQDAVSNFVKLSALKKLGFYELKSKILNFFCSGYTVYLK
ncbi:MAG: GTPase HflX [Bdellovibrionota bacterium]|nr:GTPase HflX [Pseudomonadota bacterium]MDY6090923.1 GTPase HflX [Bdellovibrionota bacterium]